MAKLGVNIDHVATLRQQRGGSEPDIVRAALLCQKAGAHSIVMHLREDRRHIQDPDLFAVQKAIGIRLNMEMSIAPDVVKVALKLKPDQVTLVPEKRRERTTESGLDLFYRTPALKAVIASFKRKNILVSLFIDPDLRQVKQAAMLGAEAVEFHTGEYAELNGKSAQKAELARLEKAVAASLALGLLPHAGHGLDYKNAGAVARIKGIDELNIGYSIVTESVWTGLEAAVQRMRKVIHG